MEERWHCKDCGAELDRVLIRYDYDDGAVATVTHLCPKCGSLKVEELEPCPTPMCGGWKAVGDHVCGTCRKRLRGDLGRFARQYSPAELSELDDLLDGTGLELFA